MPNFFFQRYVNGERMADDVLITKQQTLEAAIPEALRLCRNSPRSVLVHIADDSALREENARLREETDGGKADDCKSCGCQYESWKANYQRLTIQNDALREENARLREAVGLMTTMAPFMEMDVDDPVGMAKTVVVEQEKLFQENARLRAALKNFNFYPLVDTDKDYDTLPVLVWHLRTASAAIREGGKG